MLGKFVMNNSECLDFSSNFKFKGSMLCLMHIKANRVCCLTGADNDIINLQKIVLNPEMHG